MVLPRAAEGLRSPSLRVSMLGPFSISLGERSAGPWPRPSAKRLCELVLISPGRRITRERACEELFPNLAAKPAHNAVARALSLARAALSSLGEPATSLLQADRNQIWAHTTSLEVDVDSHQGALKLALLMPAPAVAGGLYQQLLSAWLGVSPEEGEQTARPALERAMRAVLGQPGQLLPLLAHMMGLASAEEAYALSRTSPEALQRATFGAVSEVISRLVAVGPTVLVLEDLHWADPTSMRLTEQLAALARAGPLLVLATRRPEPDPGVSALEASLCSNPGLRSWKVELSPLPGGAEVALARSLLGEAAAEAVLEAVRAGTEGNPLFLEERLSSLLATGALVRDQDGWHVDQGVASGMPEALERLVRSRVDRLGPAARDTVVAASRLGAEFSLPELAAVSPIEIGLSEALSELCSGGLLTEVAQQAPPAYRFRHALIQEATYKGIVKAERRRLHARVAWALEEASADRLDEVAGVLGHHYAAAGETERAVHYLELAGDKAASVFANEEAISSYRSALAAIGRERPGGKPLSSAAVELRAKLGELLWKSVTRNLQAREVLQEAIGLTSPADSFQAARLNYLLGRVEITNQRYDAALAALAAAERLLGDHPEDQDQATVDLWLDVLLEGRAAVHLQRNDPGGAAAELATARPVIEARGRPAQKQAFYQYLVGQAFRERRGRIDEEVLSNAFAALAAAQEGGDDYFIGYRLSNLGLCLLLSGDLEGAEEKLTAALGIGERTGELGLQVNCLAFLSIAALRRHDAEAVASRARRALEAAEKASLPSYMGMAKACLAWLARLDGRLDDVEVLAEEAGALGRMNNYGYWFLWLSLFPLMAARLAKERRLRGGRRQPGAIGATSIAPARRAGVDAGGGRECLGQGGPPAGPGQAHPALDLAEELRYL